MAPPLGRLAFAKFGGEPWRRRLFEPTYRVKIQRECYHLLGVNATRGNSSSSRPPHERCRREEKGLPPAAPLLFPRGDAAPPPAPPPAPAAHEHSRALASAGEAEPPPAYDPRACARNVDGHCDGGRCGCRSGRPAAGPCRSCPYRQN